MIPYMHSLVQQARDREILTKHSPGQIHFWKLLPPERVVFGWISIDGHLRSSMDCEICLAISFKIKSPDSDTTLHRLFKDSSHHCSAFPDHFSRHSYIDRYHLHQRCWLHAFPPQNVQSSFASFPVIY